MKHRDPQTMVCVAWIRAGVHGVAGVESRSGADGRENRVFDCAIIGAGPGGLTAAIYLRRFHREVVVLDAGNSRTRWIPTSHNCPGFPSGVSGDGFMRRLREQAAAYDTRVESTCVNAARRSREGFAFGDEAGTWWRARTAIIAAGIVDRMPDGDWVPKAIGCGALRLCAVCDAYEASGRSIAVYGPARSSLDHAIFLRTYSPVVTLVPSNDEVLTPDDHLRLQHAGVAVTATASSVDFDGARCVFSFMDGSRTSFDVVYPYLGAKAQSDLAIQLHARVDDAGELIVDRTQMTCVPGLYAIGDVVSALNQIAVALGHAAVAASAIHGRLPWRLLPMAKA